MLHLLYEYAQENGIALEPGFKPVRVRWAIRCSRTGRYYGVAPLGAEGEGREFARCPELSQGEMVSGGVTKSQFLVDDVNTVALLSEERRQRHLYFLALLERASAAMPELAGAAACLRDTSQLEAVRRDLVEHRAKPTDKVTFQIDHTFPLDSNAWHDWWRRFRSELAEGKEARGKDRADPSRMRCFVTGELVHPAATHPKIEGLVDVGGATAGSSLIGFDKASYRSYGLQQSANAAVSELAAAGYRAGLNELIQRRGERLAGAKVVHWFAGRMEAADDPFPWLTEGRTAQEANASQRAHELLRAIRSGRRPDLAQNRYYALTLSGASGRVMVRDWMEGQFEELLQHVSAWFDDLAVVTRDGLLAPEPRFKDVLRTMVRTLDDLAPPLVASMWRVAVRCEPVPRAILAAVVRRWQADMYERGDPNPVAAGLMKAFHLRLMRAKEGSQVAVALTPYLNEEHPDPAYHCGRLMAVLAALQEAALGNVVAGVVQRYYAAASSTPALVLGRLTRTSQFHLGKLEPGLAYWYDQRLAAIWSRIDGKVPATLTLEQQSLFALGYYQQLVDLRTKRTSGEKKEEERHD